MATKGGVLLYKCRSCGKTSGPTHVPDIMMALSCATTGRRTPSEWGPLQPHLVEFHFCDDGKYGVTDLIGGKED